MNADELLRDRLNRSLEIEMLGQHLDAEGAHPETFDDVHKVLERSRANGTLFDALDKARDEFQRFAVIDRNGLILAEPRRSRVQAVAQARRLRTGRVYEVYPDGRDAWTIIRYAHWSYERNGGFRRPNTEH